jgi:hypothetical protein
MLAAASASVGGASAQDGFVPPSPEDRVACAKGYDPLWQDATKKKWLIEHGTGRLPSESCKLVGDYRQAELKMVKYIETNATKCGITLQVIDQLKMRYKKTETFAESICIDAKNWPEGHPVVSDFGAPVFGLAR